MICDRLLVNPSRTAIPFWGQTTQISRSLSPKRDCGSKWVKDGPHVDNIVGVPGAHDKKAKRHSTLKKKSESKTNQRGGIFVRIYVKTFFFQFGFLGYINYIVRPPPLSCFFRRVYLVFSTWTPPSPPPYLGLQNSHVFFSGVSDLFLRAPPPWVSWTLYYTWAHLPSTPPPRTTRTRGGALAPPPAPGGATERSM